MGQLCDLAPLYPEAQGLYHAAAFGLDESARAKSTIAHAARLPALRWGEVVAAGGSSLPVLALLAGASGPLDEEDAGRIAAAYYPWVSALHISLDGVIDRAADQLAGHVNQIGHYAGAQEAGERLACMASESLSRARGLPEGELHAVILAGMAGYYLAAAPTGEPDSATVSQAVLDVLGPSARLTRLVHKLRPGTAGS